ncbi:sulfatase-like hydrolase/transferase [Pedobacter sp. MC2016-15]|uniref:sulfatase-like hydrolase/transferase n=1 Tax=Pedobacter sp. MC2016-15 TaxID=2994473 RepID=UPI0022456E2D|nr:sulfatase-like hydrolase/transferase [Pedobacter sp. MC2016-15]MCX2479857.1 sulfatase-like hydrolase/transferase [Pedobacter sp. MC2016-15]
MFESFAKYLVDKGSLSPTELELVRSVSVPKRVRKSQYWLEEGTLSNAIGFVVKGCFRQFRVGQDQQEHIMRFAIENWWIADFTSFDTGKPASSYIEALEDSELLVITKENFNHLIDTIPSFKVMIDNLETRNFEAHQNRIFSNISETADMRYDNFVKKYPTLYNRIPLYMIASFLGLTRETLSRVRKQNVKKLLILTILSLIFWSASVHAQQIRSAKGKPNVIVIYSDDQGSLDMNIYGAKDLSTPNLDRLARNGTRFSNFHSASPVCSPSRASLLTGRYPQRAGLDNNAPSSLGGEGGMPGSQFTMAELFKSGGYKTAHIGKWHMGYSPETMPNQQGFDYSFGFMGGCIDSYSHFFYWAGPNRHDLWRNGTEIWEDGKYFPNLMVDEAGKFLEDNQSSPFFMYFAINMPHYPLQGEQKWRDYYKDLPAPRRMYAAAVSTMDEKIGLLLKKVDELGLTDNTIIVFQADQGHSTEERTFGGGGYAGSNRGSKFSVFEGGILAPAIISWPGHIPVNTVRDQFSTNIDWFPTLAAYCQLTLPQRKIDGKSLVQVIASPKAKSPHEDFFWQFEGAKGNPQWAVREGDWKLLHSPRESKPADLDKDNFMLVNIKNGSTETRNEAAEHPDVVKRLQEKYQNWIREVFTQ